MPRARNITHAARLLQQCQPWLPTALTHPTCYCPLLLQSSSDDDLEDAPPVRAEAKARKAGAKVRALALHCPCPHLTRRPLKPLILTCLKPQPSCQCETLTALALAQAQVPKAAPKAKAAPSAAPKAAPEAKAAPKAMPKAAQVTLHLLPL